MHRDPASPPRLTVSTPANWLSLESAALSARIDPLGAQLSILQDQDGRDLLWNGDPAFWSGRAPILFPIVGALAGGTYRVGQRSYQLPRHGFARGTGFETVHSSASSARFRLTANASTRQIYPFEFELEVRFELAGPTLTVTSLVGNVGATPLSASLGYHPGFRWPLPYGRARDLHGIEFANEETPYVRRLDSKGLLMPERHPSPLVGRHLPLADALFENDALIFEQVRSRSVRYGASDGPQVEVAFAGVTHLGIWSKPGAPFICIEPWHGVADPQGFDGEFHDKPGIFTVAAGAERALQMSMTLLM